MYQASNHWYFVLSNNPCGSLIFIDEETEAQEVKEPKVHS